jgi:hypothetical protein
LISVRTDSEITKPPASFIAQSSYFAARYFSL